MRDRRIQKMGGQQKHPSVTTSPPVTTIPTPASRNGSPSSALTAAIRYLREQDGQVPDWWVAPMVELLEGALEDIADHEVEATAGLLSTELCNHERYCLALAEAILKGTDDE